MHIFEVTLFDGAKRICFGENRQQIRKKFESAGLRVYEIHKVEIR